MKKLIFYYFLFITAILSITSCSTFSSAENCTPVHRSLGSANFQADSTFYPSVDTTKKSIVIIPPTGSTNAIDRSYAKMFCHAGFQVVILNHWTADQETNSDLEIHQHFYSGAQQAIQLIFAELKTPFIGMLGTSVGALHTAISTNTILKLNASFLIVGGASIAEVVVESDQKAMVDLKKDRIERFHFKSDGEIVKAIDEKLKLEPTLQGELFKSKTIGMVIATEDTTVPARTQNKLRDFFKPKKVIEINSNHFWGIIKSWLFHDDEILKFFNDSASKTIS